MSWWCLGANPRLCMAAPAGCLGGQGVQRLRAAGTAGSCSGADLPLQYLETLCSRCAPCPSPVSTLAVVAFDLVRLPPQVYVRLLWPLLYGICDFQLAAMFLHGARFVPSSPLMLSLGPVPGRRR